jgi:hypothetical protein
LRFDIFSARTSPSRPPQHLVPLLSGVWQRIRRRPPVKNREAMTGARTGVLELAGRARVIRHARPTSTAAQLGTLRSREATNPLSSPDRRERSARWLLEGDSDHPSGT